MKVSLQEKKAWLTAEEEVSDDVLSAAVQRAGPYKGKVTERKPLK